MGTLPPLHDTVILEEREPASVDPVGPASHRPSSVRAFLQRRKWAIVAAAVLVVSGMFYSLAWGPLVNHASYWRTPGDIWGAVRAAHYIGWGDIGDVYAKETGLVTLPGIALLLAPFAMISGHFGWSESLPYYLPHPTAWLLIGPAELIIGATVLFPLDALAEYVGIPRRRRIALCVVQMIAVWPVVAIWGHPEDVLAMTFALYGLLTALKGRWGASGWLWGAALATQPLVVLMLPIVFAAAPVRQWTRMALKSALPGVALVLVPLIQQWHQTSRALFQQPNYPAIDHATPWIALAPVLSPARSGFTPHFAAVTSRGRTQFATSFVTTRVGEVVAAGPGRLIAIALAVVIGVWVMHRRPSPVTLLWCAAIVMGLRCVFESVMNPYYLWPPLALAILVTAISSSWVRFGVVVALVAGDTVYSYHRTGPWVWWLPTVAMLIAAIALSRPTRHHQGTVSVAITDETHRSEPLIQRWVPNWLRAG